MDVCQVVEIQSKKVLNSDLIRKIFPGSEIAKCPDCNKDAIVEKYKSYQADGSFEITRIKCPKKLYDGPKEVPYGCGKTFLISREPIPGIDFNELKSQIKSSKPDLPAIPEKKESTPQSLPESLPPIEEKRLERVGRGIRFSEDVRAKIIELARDGKYAWEIAEILKKESKAIRTFLKRKNLKYKKERLRREPLKIDFSTQMDGVDSSSLSDKMELSEVASKSIVKTKNGKILNIDEITESLKTGERLCNIAMKIGVSESTICYHLDKRGFERRKYRKVTEDEENKIFELYEEGKNAVQISEKLGIKYKIIINKLNKKCIYLRKSKKNKILSLYNEGKIIKEIVDIMGVSRNYVYRILKEWKKRKGEDLPQSPQSPAPLPKSSGKVISNVINVVQNLLRNVRFGDIIHLPEDIITAIVKIVKYKEQAK